MKTLTMLAIAFGVALSSHVSAQDVLATTVPSMSFENKTLPEAAELLTGATKVNITIAPEIRECMAKQKSGCDWVITADGAESPLESALGTVTTSGTGLMYRVMGPKTIQITKRPAK